MLRAPSSPGLLHASALRSPQLQLRAHAPPARPSEAGVGSEHPRPELERWTMADVLTMPARELRNPVSSGVLLEPHDRLPHRYQRIEATIPAAFVISRVLMS